MISWKYLMVFQQRSGYTTSQVLMGSWLRLALVNLRNRTGEERTRQTLCDKRDNNFVWNNVSPNFTFLETDLFAKDQKTSVWSEDYDKTRK